VEALKRFRQFVSDTWVELKKTSWPTRREVYGTTVVVIVFVFITAAFLFVADVVLGRGMRALLGLFE